MSPSDASAVEQTYLLEVPDDWWHIQLTINRYQTSILGWLAAEIPIIYWYEVVGPMSDPKVTIAVQPGDMYAHFCERFSELLNS